MTGPEHYKILVAEKYSDDALCRLQAVGDVLELPAADEATLVSKIADFDALVVRTYTQVTRKVIEAGANLRVIGRGGVGLENIDVDAAKDRNVEVVYTPAASTESVADLTIGLILGLLRGIARGDTLVRDDRFLEGRNAPPSRELSELTLGILGMGRIGRAVGRRARNGFGMTVLYHDVVMPGLLDFSARAVARDELYAHSDIVSLSVPLAPQTQQMIDDKALATFRRGALLVNTARGGVVDSCALAEALHSGRLGGAALDVFDPEPLPPGHPLLTAPNTLFTPHVGARTVRGLAGMNAVVDDVIRVLQGKRPMYPAWE